MLKTFSSTILRRTLIILLEMINYTEFILRIISTFKNYSDKYLYNSVKYLPLASVDIIQEADEHGVGTLGR